MARHALRYLFGRGGSGAPGAAGPLLPQGGALGAYLHRERAALAQAGKALEDVKEVSASAFRMLRHFMEWGQGVNAPASTFIEWMDGEKTSVGWDRVRGRLP